MIEKDHITIVSSSNEAFVPHLATLFFSLLKTKQEKTTLHFYVLDDHISLKSKFLLNRTVNQYEARITYLTVDPSAFSNAVESERIPRTAYYRICIPQLLKDQERAIYLDCDMISMRDIQELWTLDLKGNLLAAVEDAGLHDRLNAMHIDYVTDVYFNSGMMVMDLEKWREQNITEQALDFISANQDLLRFHDQDALNAILHDRWLELHPIWNAQTYIMLEEKTHPAPEGRMRWEETRQDPALIHFCGHEKPWHENSCHPFKDAYDEVFQQTAFSANGLSSQEKVNESLPML